MIGRFMFCNHINDIPHIFEGYFPKISGIHDYEIRSNEGLYVKHVKSDLCKTSISYRGPIIWNMIKNNGIDTDISEVHKIAQEMFHEWFPLSVQFLQLKYCPSISTY